MPRRVLYLFHETLFQAAYDRRRASSASPAGGRGPDGRSTAAEGRPPDAAARARARERLAPVYDFVRRRFGREVPATWMQ